MAGKSPTELARELSIAVAALNERSAHLSKDVGWLDASIARLDDGLRDVRIRSKMIEGKFEDLKRAYDEAERRRWQIWVVGIAAVPSLLANLVLTFTRKPG